MQEGAPAKLSSVETRHFLIAAWIEAPFMFTFILDIKWNNPFESLAFAHLYIGNMQTAQVEAESAMAKGSTTSFVTEECWDTYT